MSPRRLAPLLTVLLALVACGDDEPDRPTAPPADVSDAPSGAGPTDADDDGAEGAGEAPEPATTLPDAPPLGGMAASGILHELAADLAADEVSRAVLLYLHDLGDATALEAARGQLLVRDEEGDWDDEDAAALGLEIAMLHGEGQAEQQALDLAEELLDDEYESAWIATALGRVGEGPRRERAEGLLARMVDSGDDLTALAALEVLGGWGSHAADSALPGIAADVERWDLVRGTAVAVMDLIDHPRAEASGRALVESSENLAGTIDGFALEGATGTVPLVREAVRRAMEREEELPPLKQGAVRTVFDSACYALVDIHGTGEGAGEAREIIAGWLESDPSLAGDASVYSLWMLGDDSVADELARILVRDVANAATHDVDLVVDVLDELAIRGGASEPPFDRIVDAAAAAKATGDAAGENHRVLLLRAAAAHARLR